MFKKKAKAADKPLNPLNLILSKLDALLAAQSNDDDQIIARLKALAANLGFLTNEVNNANIRLMEVLHQLTGIAEVLEQCCGSAKSGTVTFGGNMDITVHLSDVPQKASAHEWTGPLGTGTEVPPGGAITWASDNAAAVTVDASSGQLAYVAAGVANISFTDAGNSITGSGSVTVVANVAVSGTVTFA